MPLHRVVYVLVAAAVILVHPVSGFAQQVGIKAGINFASLTPEENEDPDLSRRRGFVGGVWVRTTPVGRYSFQAEGLFSEKGVRFDATALGLDGEADVRFRYFEAPLLAHVDFGSTDASPRFFVVGGIAPAVKLSARARAVFEGEEQTQDVGEQTEMFDVGLVAGVGIAMGRAVIEARHTHGLMRTNTDHNEPNDRVRNRVFSVTIGVRVR